MKRGVSVLFRQAILCRNGLDTPEGLWPEGMAVERPNACDNRWVQMTGTMTCTPNFDWAISFGKNCGVEGERGPMTNPNARAQFTGLSSEHTAAHMLRAV